jgi:hypothetical protein
MHGRHILGDVLRQPLPNPRERLAQVGVGGGPQLVESQQRRQELAAPRPAFTAR